MYLIQYVEVEETENMTARRDKSAIRSTKADVTNWLDTVKDKVVVVGVYECTPVEFEPVEEVVARVTKYRLKD